MSKGKMMSLFYKTIVASMVSATMITSAQAADALVVYGKLNVSAQYNDVAGDSETTVQSNASRFGVKGEYALNDALTTFYMLEYEVNTGDDSKDNFDARNQYVGLKGNFGAISAGRNDTMLKISQGKVDQFNDYSGDIKNLFKGDNRIEQTITYLSPSFNHFAFGVTYAAEGSSSQEIDKVVVDPSTGLESTVTESDDGFSVAAFYGDKKFKKTNVYAAIAYDSEVKGYDVLRATVQAKFAAFVVGGMYQQQQESDNGDSQDGYLVSAAYNATDMLSLKAQWQDMEDKGDSWSVGGDYKLGKPTKLFAFYTERSFDSSTDDDSYVGVGIEHKF